MVDISGPLAIHLVGIGGSGMNAIGVVLAEMGHRVSGSDLRRSLGVMRLEAMGAQVHIGHDAHHVEGAQLVAHSTAIRPDNPELVRSRELGLPVLSRAQMLRAICDAKDVVAVGGTHGKTTTSSMLALCLVAAGLHPSFVVGGDLNEIGGGAVWSDDGDLLVVEADESDGTFVELGADVALVTSLEADHLDYYGSQDRLVAAFERFVAAASELAVICADDPAVAQLAQHAPGRCVTYGHSPDADYSVLEPRSARHGVHFTLLGPNGPLGPVTLAMAGLHNAANATAAAATAVELGAEPTAVIGALERFAGVARRFEMRGVAAGVTFVDDYAHLPSEVAATIAAANDGDYGRVVAVFQPHRFTRTRALWQSFADAFDAADITVITDIYPAGEVAPPGITGELVSRAVRQAHPKVDVVYVADRAQLAELLVGTLRANDVCLTMGAGDLTTLPDELIERLGERRS